MRIGFVFLSALLVACSGSSDGSSDNGTTDDTGSNDPFFDYINLGADVQTTGDFSCFTPVADAASAEWLTQTVDPAKVSTATVTARTEDFETEAAVSNPTVDLWYNDAVSGTADTTIDGDVNGLLTIEAPICQAHTYRVTTDPVLDETKTTYKAHSFYGTEFADGSAEAVFTSVSKTTYQLIPTIVGVSVDPNLAIIAGTAFDCTRAVDEDPGVDDGKIEGAQVVVYDENGNIPDTLAVKYFTEGFPDRDQPYTSADGLWVAANVPPGRLTVEMWGRVGGELVLLGATQVDSEADSINIANVFSGYGDGVKLPASCLAE